MEGMRDLTGSKKFLASVLASVLAMIGLAIGMEYEKILLALGPLLLYVPSQAVADIGKERAKVERQESLADALRQARVPKPTPDK